MATKLGIKSKIPIMNPRKELLPEAVGITLSSNSPKSMEIKETKGKTKMVKKEMDVKNKMTRELKQFKGGIAEKVTAKEKAAFTKTFPMQRPTGQSVVRSTIVTVSKEMAHHMKTEKKKQDGKSSTELVDNGANVISNNTDESNSKRKSGEKTETSPSQMVQPKMYLPHSGLMLKPPVKKNTVVFKPFNFHPNRPKLRRSKSQYDPDFERPLPENIRPQQSNKIIAENYTTDQKTKAAKSSTLSKTNELSALVKNKIRKEISQVPPRKPLVPLRMSKNLPGENKSTKPLALKSKPLRRTNTFHVFNSVPILKKYADAEKELLNPKRITEKAISENETPVTPENIRLSQQVEDFVKQITPKKQVPHRGLVFHATRKGNEKKFNAFPKVD